MSSARRRSRLSSLPLVFAMTMSASANAFDPGGHHNTLSAAFSTANRPIRDDASKARRLEAFCAQLPDLAEELDATTQRANVFLWPSGWLWGAFNACSTSAARHMVAAQFYLHALTGVQADRVRRAARALVVDLSDAIAKAPDAASAARLACERGFAEHLLGDTYAHVELRGGVKLYPTGFGHKDDGDTPDLMLSRPRFWQAWLAEIQQTVAPETDAVRVWQLSAAFPGCGADAGFCEDPMRAKQHAFTQPKDFWQPYQPPLDEWANYPERSATPIIGEAVNMYHDRILQTSCQDQLERGPANRTGGSGIGKLVPQMPKCDDVWADYFARAKAEFDDAGVNPPCGADPATDSLGDGR